MARSLFFEKRSGGVHYRCGNCGQDQPIDTPFPALKLARLCRDLDQLEQLARGFPVGGVRVPAPAPLMLGAKLVALVCPSCCAPTLRQLEELAPRSYVDTDGQANLLGDF